GMPAVVTTVLAPPRRTGRWWLPLSLVILAAALFLAVHIGPAGTISSANWNLIWNLRMPRVALAALVGGMLAVAGASYQGAFGNPLADPYLLGVAAGSGLGATVVFVTSRATTSDWIVDPLPLASFVGGLTAVLLTYLIGAAFGSRRSSLSLLLAGVAITSLATAVQTFVLYRNSDVIREVYSWILGRLNTATWGDVRLVTPYIVISMVVLLLHRRHLDLMRVGDDEAAALGVRVGQVRLIVVMAATFGTAAAVSVSGLIGFVGIVVPHAVRMLAGSSYRRLLPLSIVLGAAFLVLTDIPGRSLSTGAETPIGVVTAFFGAPFFIVVLIRRRLGRTS
ncbi:MAG TPA: iron ABC transporter permease, partial [Ilumatobacteraceae bacterium]|nr:iron ABC transporter permease [Ilumatobacteraceae bacterium]